jgi:hypothetical protein
MNDIYYYLSQSRVKDLLRQAENEREAQAILRENKRNRPHWLRRFTDQNHNRLDTGEKN